jgi:hypothetical protein
VSGDTQVVREIVRRHQLLIICFVIWLGIAALILLFHKLDDGGPAIAT